jgi:hypothetical protein
MLKNIIMKRPTLKEFGRRLLLGLLVWGLPFIGSFFVWDTENGGPSISAPWFYAIMAVLGAIGLAIAAFLFLKVKQPKECVIGTGVLWYLESLLLDALFLVVLFGMTWAEYSHLFVTYLTIPVFMILIANVKK